MKRFALVLLVLSCLASGCANKGVVGSFFGEMPQKNGVIPAIAEDAAAYLAGKYPPGHTTLQILPAGKSTNAFDSAFDSRLRALGFTVRPSTPAAPGALTVSYILDQLEADSSYYLQLRLSDGAAISRAYTATGQPEAGRSSTPHEFKVPVMNRIETKARSAYTSTVEMLH